MEKKNDIPTGIPEDAAVLRVASEFLGPLCRYFDVRLESAANIPDGAVMLVGNHALMGIDSVVLFPELYRRLNRVPRGLALRSLFDVPVLKKVLHSVGVVEGRRDTAIELLENDEMVVTYPGGARDSIKSKDKAYELQWEGRLGFADVALRAGVPVVPVAGIGPDDVFPVLSKGLFSAPFLGDKSYRVPLFLPIARPIPFTFRFGEPIEPPEIDDGDEAGELSDMARRDFALRVQDSLQELLDAGLEERGEVGGFLSSFVERFLG